MITRIYHCPRDIPRLVVGAVFLYAALSKTVAPLAFLQVLGQLQEARLPGLPALGESITSDSIYGALLVLAEYFVGVAALFRLAPKAAILGAFLLNSLFVFVLSLHWGQTLHHGCGCLGLASETVVGVGTLWKNFALYVAIGLAAYFTATQREADNDGL